MPLTEQIRIRTETKKLLDTLKLVERDTYDSVIMRILIDKLEDNIELNAKVKQDLLKQMKKIKEGKVKSFNEVLQDINDERVMTSKKGLGTGQESGCSDNRGDNDVLGD